MVYLRKVKPTINIEDLAKVDLRVGKVVQASLVEKSEKLIKLTVDFGEDHLPSSEQTLRIIFTGMRKWYAPDFFEGKMFVFAYNLEPKPIMGGDSKGMLLAVDTQDGPKPLKAPVGCKTGDRIR